MIPAGCRQVLLLGCFLIAQPALADRFDNEFEEKPWAEIEVQLPPFPAAEDLVAFKVGAVEDKRFTVDVKSLTVGSDGVIRYTLVVLSAAGARTISYEGIRCDTAERRLYAFGRSDKTWSKARSNQWTKITGSTNNHHVVLHTDLFCRNGATPFRNDEDARRALRTGEPQLWLYVR